MSGRRFINRFAFVILFGLAAAPAWSQEPIPAPEEMSGEVEEVVVAPEPNAPLPKELKALVVAEAENLLPQLRPLLRAELHLIHHVCKTSVEDQRALAKTGDGILKAVTLKVAEWAVRAQQVGVEGNIPDAVGMIQDGLASAVASRLSRRQTEDYQDEVGRRIRALRDAAARVVVARFDGLLGLDADQRGKIAASLFKSNALIVRELDAVLDNVGEFPEVPESAFAPHLDARSRNLWRETQTGNHDVRSDEPTIVGLNTDAADFAEEDDPVDAAKETIRHTLMQIIQGVSAGLRPAGNEAAVVALPAVASPD